MALNALKKISEIKHQTEVSQNEEVEEKEDDIPKTKYLIFYIGKEKFSIKECLILNILKTVKLYSYPFAPDFVDGVISAHSKICSVVNYKKMTGDFSENLELILYVILETDTDNFALRVSRIEDFFMIPDDAYSEETEKKNNFIQGYILLNDEKIPVLDIPEINQKIITSCSMEAK